MLPNINFDKENVLQESVQRYFNNPNKRDYTFQRSTFFKYVSTSVRHGYPRLWLGTQLSLLC